MSNSAVPWTVALQAPLSVGILQARILKWVAMPSSRGSSQPRDQTCASYRQTGREILYRWATRETHRHTYLRVILIWKTPRGGWVIRSPDLFKVSDGIWFLGWLSSHSLCMSLRYDSLLHLAGYEHAQLITVRSHHPQVYFGEQQTLPAVRPLATAPLFPTTMCPEGIQDEKSRKLALDIVKMENEMTTHSSIPAWEIWWTKEPGGL